VAKQRPGKKPSGSQTAASAKEKSSARTSSKRKLLVHRNNEDLRRKVRAPEDRLANFEEYKHQDDLSRKIRQLQGQNVLIYTRK
jgi:hypothetical protein